MSVPWTGGTARTADAPARPPRAYSARGGALTHAERDQLRAHLVNARWDAAQAEVASLDARAQHVVRSEVHAEVNWYVEAFAQWIAARATQPDAEGGALTEDERARIGEKLRRKGFYAHDPARADVLDAVDEVLAARTPRGGALGEDVLDISRMIDASYPSGLDAEAHRWRRCAKIGEEWGEATEALLGLVGENPRKGQTHDHAAVRKELLDVALAALGAVAHVDGNEGDPMAALVDHAAFVATRLRDALADRTTRPAPDDQREAT